MVADALDERPIRAAVVAAHPDVIVHELTDLKGASGPAQVRSRLRKQQPSAHWGTDHLLAAARDCGVRRIVAQSFCGWPYARTGGQVKSEEDPLDPNPPQQLRRTCSTRSAIWNASSQRPRAPEGVVLRYGAFYGLDTGMFDAALIEQIREAVACHSSAARRRVVSRSCKSMTPRRRPPWRSNSEEASTISSTTIPRRSTNGAARDRRNARRKAAVPRVPAGRLA